MSARDFNDLIVMFHSGLYGFPWEAQKTYLQSSPTDKKGNAIPFDKIFPEQAMFMGMKKHVQDNRKLIASLLSSKDTPQSVKDKIGG